VFISAQGKWFQTSGLQNWETIHFWIWGERLFVCLGVFCLFFCGVIGVWTVVFKLAKQALYGLSHRAPVHFALVILVMSPGWPRILILLISVSQTARITDRRHCTRLTCMVLCYSSHTKPIQDQLH
jgi:hypothetical protein